MLLPRLTYCSPRNFTLITRFALLAPGRADLHPLAVLPSSRAIPNRDVFYVALPKKLHSLDRDVFYIGIPISSILRLKQ